MRTVSSEMLSLSAVELSRRLHSREISSVDLMQATLDRIDEVNPQLRAIIALRKDREDLLQEALDADAHLASAISSTSKNTCWLRGIPIAIKDMDDAKGLPTTLGGCPLFSEQSMLDEDTDDYYTFGNWMFKNEVEDAPFVKRLRDAGAIIVGKTNAPELAMGCHSYNNIHGTTLNPYNLALSAGGSSGGAAAALSSHMVAVSDGSDMMGSLRNPAGWHSLYSIRPTAGWMEDVTFDETDGATGNEDFTLPYPMSTVGPMARCPEDLTLFLKTILPDNRAAKFDASAINTDSLEELSKLVMSSKIGWLNDWGGSLPFEDGVLSHCKSSIDLFRVRGGADIECITDAPFPNDELWRAWMVIRSNTIFNSLREKLDCESREVIPTLQARGVKAEAIWECQQAQSFTRQHLDFALEKIREWSNTANEMFEMYDFLALPSSQVYPFDASMDWPKSIDGEQMDTYHRWMNVMVPVTLLGAPCLTIPAGLGTRGLPMGIQIFTGRGNDAKLLKLARWYHMSKTCG